MNLRLPYGDGYLAADVSWARCLGVLDVARAEPAAGADALTRDALAHPHGMTAPVFEALTPGEPVVIVVSDSFRKTGIDRVLPALLDALREAGARDDDIAFVFATGTHRPPTPSEQEHILGAAVYERFRDQLYPHDPTDAAGLVTLGTTSRGTPVRINRRVAEAGRLIVTGTVVLHYFGGFGGGRKSLLPGVAGLDSISHNHAMNLHPREDILDPAVRIGVTEGNPVAEDMAEAAEFVHVDCLVNTVLNRDGEVAAVFAGDLVAAHRAAAEYARGLYAVPIDACADLVVAASGPTRNYVQSHKALYNAYQAVKPNGRIVLAARCEEGLGGEQFVKWLRLGSPGAVIAALREHSEINGQTALSTLAKMPVTTLVTDLDGDEVALLGGRKAASVADALEAVRAELPARPSCYVMPSAAYTVPFLPPH
jgi:nickel-dependent lactate racemase